MQFRRIHCATIGILLLFAFANRASAQSSLPPGVTVQLKATPHKATIGDPIRIDVEVAMPSGCKAEILKTDKPESDFAILSFSSEPIIADQNKSTVRRKAHLTIAIYKIGPFTLPPMRVILEDSSGKKVVALSAPLTIEIKSILTKDAALKGLKKQAEIPEKFNWALWLIVGLAACLLGFLGWWIWKRKHRRPVSISATSSINPLDAAEKELLLLLQQGLPTTGMEKKFYILLSDIVKRILEAGFGISTEEQTSFEIMTSLRQVPGMDAGAMELTDTFLASCDAVKFAKYIPSGAEHEIAGQRAMEILAAARAAVSCQ